MTDDIETLADWNAWLTCCCPMPACPIPLKVCESLTRTSTSADDNHTDALAEWTAKKARFDAHTAWEASPEPKGPEPIDEPDPLAAPEPLAGYSDVAHGSWAPFTRPAGDPAAEIPTLYRELASVNGEVVYTGDIKFYYAVPGTSYGSFYIPSSNRFVEWTGNGTSFDYTAISRQYDYGVDIGADGGWAVRIIAEDEETEGFPPIPAPFAWITRESPTSPPCTATMKISVTVDRYAEAAGSAEDVPTLAITEDPEADDTPAGWEEADDWQWSNLTEKTQDSAELGEDVDKAAVIARATAKMPVGWDDPDGEACVASVATVWPKIGDLLSGADPEVEPPIAASWPPCNSPELPISTIGSATATKARFRWSVPSLVVPGLVTELDPDPDPVDWWRGTYFKVIWQTCFFSTEWTAWKLLWDAYEAAKELHDQWVADGSVVPALPALPPEAPSHPGPQPTPPTLGADEEDVWTGPGDPNDDDSWLFPGGWHEIDTPAAAGETRVVNVRFYCYPASPYGYKPQVTGEGYEPFTVPDPPAPEP